MIGTTVTIEVHAQYVQTRVRFYGSTGLQYVEYARFGADVPRAVLDAPDNARLHSLIRDWIDEPYDVRAPYFPEFMGHLELRYTLPDPESNDFFMNEARYISPKRGGRNIVGAFQNVTYKRAILTNIANAISEKNASKLDGIIKALETVNG